MDLGMNEYIHWPNPEMFDYGLPEANMVEMYNCFDCTITVANEGFWMPGIESLRCGVPLIAPDYAAAADRVAHGCGYKVKIRDWSRNDPIAVRQPLVDVVDAARKITKIINGDREKYARRCVRESDKYRWSKLIEEKWNPFLEECEAELRPMIKAGKIARWDQEIE